MYISYGEPFLRISYCFISDLCKVGTNMDKN